MRRLVAMTLLVCACVTLTGCGTAVPDVTGKPVAQGQETIAAAGFRVGTVTYDETAIAAAGLVISQTPGAGTAVDAGSAVSLVVAGPAPVVVPVLSGLDKVNAEAVLTGVGLTLGAVTEAHEATATVGLVVSQTPTAGAAAARGSAVAIVVNIGPEPVAIPSVVGKTKVEATTLLEAAGFKVKVADKDNKAKKGTAVAQSPAAGKLAQPGSTVSVTISTGVDTPSTSEILTAFARHYSPYNPGHRRLLWKGRDKRGVWWAAVGLGPDEAGDGYAICGYRTGPNKWVVQDVGQPDGAVMVSSTWRPKPPAEVVAAMKRHGVPVFEE